MQCAGGDNFQIDPVQIGLVHGGGTPLPRAVMAKMEAAFDADFSAVRVHVGPQAARIGAIAFTTGSDIYFAPGRFQPDSMQGQQLLGHEHAHLMQQRQGRVRASGSGTTVVQDRALEAEADRLGQRAAQTTLAVQAQRQPGPVQTPPRGAAPVAPIQCARRTRSQVDLSAVRVNDIPGYDQMGLESQGGGGGGFDYFSGTGSVGEKATALAHGVGNMLTGQGGWANLLWFTHRTKDSGRVAVRARARDVGDYNPTANGVSATNYVSGSNTGINRLRGLNVFGTPYHWSHLVASSLGGSNRQENVVSASKWANGEMLAIEGWLKSRCLAGDQLDVRVRATLAWGEPHLAENIRYEIFRRGGGLIYSRTIDARRAVPLTGAERQTIVDALDAALGP